MMFGHDNQNKTNQQADTTTVVPDDNKPANNDVTGAPGFDTSAVSLDNGSSSPSSDQSSTEADSTTQSPAPDTTTTPSDNKNSDLIQIKTEALQQLSPLVNHLDQTPEEKFKTTMMMIQASDDQSLIKPAFEAAKQIKDDKVRAQAFLDIINEINYFTQN